MEHLPIAISVPVISLMVIAALNAAYGLGVENERKRAASAPEPVRPAVSADIHTSRVAARDGATDPAICSILALGVTAVILGRCLASMCHSTMLLQTHSQSQRSL